MTRPATRPSEAPGEELRLGPVRITVETPSSAGAGVRFRFAAPPGPVAPGMHVHPLAAEHVEIHHGALLLRRAGRRTVLLRAGDHASVPAGTAHSLWAVAPGTRGVALLTPAIRIDELFAELAAELGRRPPRPWRLARITGRHLDHTRFARIPVGVQQRVFGALGLGRG